MLEKKLIEFSGIIYTIILYLSVNHGNIFAKNRKNVLIFIIKFELKLNDEKRSI